MLEALVSKEIDFVDQVISVRTAQISGKYFRNGCRETNCAVCSSYQVAYLVIVNLMQKFINFPRSRPIALALEFTKASKWDLDKVVNQVRLEKLYYAKRERIEKLSEMLKGKAPDFPKQEKFLQGLVTEISQTFHLEGERL